MKSPDRRLIRQGGFSLLEILIVVAIFGILVWAYMVFFSEALVFTKKTDDRRFAVQKAIGLMEEVRAFVESGSETQIEALDDFDDGEKWNAVLTLAKDVNSALDPLSGNKPVGSEGWKYFRRVRVEKLVEEESKSLRQVSVSVSQSDDGTAPGKIRADISGIFRTISSPLPPTQVLDIYLIAIENIPGWWVNMSTLRPLVENALGDLEAANPGLKLRTHWITRNAYGRDRAYNPSVNVEKLAQQEIDQVYFYPGKITRQGFWYYSPDLILGKIQVDGRNRNVDSKIDDEDLESYALADQFNASLRFPDEKRIYEKRHAAGLDPEPSLRLFLDDMIENPDHYRNALIMNLHGELLPLPPLRNYSDAAKSPINHPGIRVVTHPERLYVDKNRPVKLRVYPYVTNPNDWNPDSVLKDGVSILLLGVRDLGPIQIEMIAGGSKKSYARFSLPADEVGTITGEGVLLNLPDVPLRHGPKDKQGLPTQERLYGMEYIPAPVESENDFSRDLSTSGNEPKNTARYVITIPASALPRDGNLVVETRLGGDNRHTGTLGRDPENLSRTYVWIGNPPPTSEQFQYCGDPRHMPYADVKERAGYNWYFREISNDSGYGGFGDSRNGWTEEAVDVDLPRYYDLVRKALLRTHSVFTNMTGFSFYYIGLGGEIGSDRPNGFPDGLPIDGNVYGVSGVKMVRSITDGLDAARAVSGDWYAIPWLGELYPDSHYRIWQQNGNLPGGKKSGQFYRESWSQMPASGKMFDRKRRTNVWGSASFFNAVGEKSGPFNHIFSSRNQAIATAKGMALDTIFNFPIQEKVDAIRPFTLDSGINYPPEWENSSYSSVRNHTRALETYYAATENKYAYSSALLHLTGSNPVDGAYMVVNGLSPAGEIGTAYIGRYSVLSLLQGFLSGGGNPDVQERIPQLPLLRIVSPKESADFSQIETAEISWDINWLRWDYQPYTAALEKGFSERTALVYAFKISPDEGRTWFSGLTDRQVRLGEYPKEENERIFDTKLTWNLRDKKGNYILRIEAFRPDISLHYAFHQVGVSVKP